MIILCGLAVVMSARQGRAGFFDGTPKWGSPTLGTGAVVTWSLIPDGTDVIRPPSVDEPFILHDFWIGTSDLSSVYAQLDPDVAIGEALFRTALTGALDTWAAAANLTFVEVSDAGVPLGYPGATAGVVGDIRIGSWSLASPFDAVAAHAFEPPGGSSLLSSFLAMHSPSTFGDVTLNKDAFFSTWPGLSEGDFYGGFPNDIQNLLLHEIGHSLGLTHSDDIDSIMYVGPGCCDYIQRTLSAEDVANIQTLYGTLAPVPEPSTLAIWGIGAMMLGASRLRKKREGESADEVQPPVRSAKHIRFQREFLHELTQK